MNVKNDNSTLENVAKGAFDETKVDEGFIILLNKNESDKLQYIEREIDSDFIQFHFCLKGSIKFNFNNGRYVLDILEENSLLLYNPQRELPINLEISPKSWLITVLISIKKFHGLFSQEADYITFLSDDNRDKKYYKDGKISPSMAIVLNQLINYNLNRSIKNLYFKGKAYEILSLYFNRNEEGFKQIYGDSVYSFLFEYKMEVARKLLESGNYNVSEVGLKVGYSTASHFIAAFKKKYRTTPKKYIMSLS